MKEGGSSLNKTFREYNLVFKGLNNTVLSFSGINNFINNSAGSDGGAIYTEYNTVLNFNGANVFINNSAGAGGAIATNNTILSLNGTTVDREIFTVKKFSSITSTTKIKQAKYFL